MTPRVTPDSITDSFRQGHSTRVPKRLRRRCRYPYRYVRYLTMLLVTTTIGASPLFAQETRPNFVLCMTDDQGWGDVGYNGHSELRTPHLDAMASAALRFDRFYAAAPVCSPTRGSVLTGRHPNRFGCYTWGFTLRPQEVTVAERLVEAGYATGHFGKWHLGSVRAASPVCPGNSGFERWVSSPNFYENDPWMSDQGRAVRLRGESSMSTMEIALAFIRESTEADRPFLAVVWFGNPHGPHVAVAEDKRPYAHLPERLQNYYGELTGIDRAMGRLREELRRLDIADRTLVWFTSDNGAQGPGSTGGLRGRKGSLWEGGIRVPAIIEWPARIASPRRSSVPAGTVDILPTVTELAGIESPPPVQPLDGISLVPLIDGEMRERRSPLGFWEYEVRGRPRRSGALLEALAEEQQRGEESNDAELLELDAHRLVGMPRGSLVGHSAWIDGRWKLHRLPADQGIRWELYDLEADPEESRDLADQQPERVAAMREQLLTWQRSVIESSHGRDY